MGWIKENQVFSGIAGTLVTLGVAYWMTRPPSAPSATQTPTGQLTPQTNASPKPRYANISSLGFDKLLTTWETARPLQREAVGHAYEGIVVQWGTELVSATPITENQVRLFLGVPERHFRLVACNISLSDYPELRISEADTPVTVTGRIKHVDIVVELEGCELVIHPTPVKKATRKPGPLKGKRTGPS